MMMLLLMEETSKTWNDQHLSFEYLLFNQIIRSLLTGRKQQHWSHENRFKIKNSLESAHCLTRLATPALSPPSPHLQTGQTTTSRSTKVRGPWVSPWGPNWGTLKTPPTSYRAITPIGLRGLSIDPPLCRGASRTVANVKFSSLKSCLRSLEKLHFGCPRGLRLSA